MNDKINYYLNLVLENDFPQTRLKDNDLKAQYNNLIKKDLKPLSSTAINLLYHFYPSIWRCNRRGFKAPVDAWADPKIMYKVIENRLRYKGDKLTPSILRNGLTISGKAPKVSIFKPALAKYLIKKYLNNFNTVFDPCSGFGGRLLGTTALNKVYIGQDINSTTIKETNNLINYLNLNAKVYLKNSIYTTGTYPCLFTCPPYADKENWHQDIEVLSCDEWIDICLKNYKCKVYLFVVDHTVKYKNFIVEEIVNKSHLNKNTEYIILIKA